jgi:hypothetical protein
MSVEAYHKELDLVVARFNDEAFWDASGVEDWPPSLFFQCGTGNTALTYAAEAGPHGENLAMEVVRSAPGGAKYKLILDGNSVMSGYRLPSLIKLIELAEVKCPGAKRRFCNATLKRHLKAVLYTSWKRVHDKVVSEFPVFSLTCCSSLMTYVLITADLHEVSKYVFRNLCLFRTPGELVVKWKGGGVAEAEAIYWRVLSEEEGKKFREEIKEDEEKEAEEAADKLKGGCYVM